MSILKRREFRDRELRPTTSFWLSMVFGFGAFALATTASAQALEISPFMSVEVVVKSARLLEEGAPLQRDKEVAAYTVSPIAVVTINDPTPPRPATFPASLPIGAKLFRAEVDNGSTFCAFRAGDQGIRHTQCFRDLDRDGTFDAGYRTDRLVAGATLYVGRLALLTAIPKVAYVAVADENLPTDEWIIRFVGISRGKAQFAAQFGSRRNNRPLIQCSISGTEACRLGNHDFVFAVNSGTLVVASRAQASQSFSLTPGI